MKFRLLDYKKRKIHMYKGLRWNSVRREPDTVKWIEKMKPGSVLYDVGCHVGAFSLIAAKRGIIVYGFEPSVPTFNVLIQNILKNKCQNKIFPSNIPLDDKEKVSFFYYSTLLPKKSGHNFGEATRRAAKPVFKQMMLSSSIDDLVYKHLIPSPDYIKIDIDGKENDVLRGATSVISSKNCRSILVEANDVNEIQKSLSSNYELLGTFSGRNRIYERKNETI